MRESLAPESVLDYLSSRTGQSFFVSLVSQEEIKILINSMKSGKAVGPHSIPVFLLKILNERISVPLSEIINDYFFLQEYFPIW